MDHETKSKKKKSGKIWAGIGTAFLLLYGAASIIHATDLDQIKTTVELWKYNKPVKECIREAEDELEEGKTVFGIEYACAIDVASDLYETDPDLAIELCGKYNPIFDYTPGKEYSTFEDPYDARNAGLVRASCKSSIQGRIDDKEFLDQFMAVEDVIDLESDEESAEAEEMDADNENGETFTFIDEGGENIQEGTYFTNNTYNYTIAVLPSDTVYSNQFAEVPEKAFSIGITDDFSKLVANIEVLDENLFDNPDIKAAYQLPLDEYAQHIASMNTLDEPIHEKTIDGYDARLLIIQDTFDDDSGGYVFIDGTKLHAFLFVDVNGLLYQIEYPYTLGHRGKQVAESIQFN